MIPKGDAYRNTEQKNEIPKLNGLTTMDSIEPFQHRNESMLDKDTRDQLTMGNVNQCSIVTSNGESMTHLTSLNIDSSKKKRASVNVFYP